MLNSALHEILNAHKYKNKEIQFNSGSDKPIIHVLLFLLINVKMPTIGILTCISRKISWSAELSVKFLLTTEPVYSCPKSRSSVNTQGSR